MISIAELNKAQLIRKYSTFKELSTTFNQDVSVRLLNNEEVAYLSNSPTIGLVIDTYGRDNGILWIKTQIMTLDFFNGTKQTADKDVLTQLSELIAHKYRLLKVTEFLLFIAKFKIGIYGKFYGSFDPIAIGEALNNFCKDRKQAIEYHESKQQKSVEWFKPPEGYSSLTWYEELKKRALNGDSEAIELLKPSKK